MTILDPCMSLEGIKKNLVVLGVVDMRQLLLKSYSCTSSAVVLGMDVSIDGRRTLFHFFYI